MKGKASLASLSEYPVSLMAVRLVFARIVWEGGTSGVEDESASVAYARCNAMNV